MNNRALLIIWSATFALFVWLIFTEPIGYNPFALSAFFFIVFACLYLIGTGSSYRWYAKVPRIVKLMLSLVATVCQVLLAFYFGWLINKELNPADSFFHNDYLAGVILVLAIVHLVQGYRKLKVIRNSRSASTVGGG